VSKYFDITPTQFAELRELLRLRFWARDFVRVCGGALVEIKFDVTVFVWLYAIGESFGREN
jgi:hypothetical protein